MCVASLTCLYIARMPPILASPEPVMSRFPVNPVYAGSLGIAGLTDVPWDKADPLSFTCGIPLLLVYSSSRREECVAFFFRLTVLDISSRVSG